MRILEAEEGPPVAIGINCFRTQDVSVNALLDMFEKIHSFTGQSKMPIGAKISRLQLRIVEDFDA